MAVTTTPAFTQSGLLGIVQITVANTNRDGSTGTYSSSVAAGSNGSPVDGILFKCTTNSVAGLLRIFYSADNSSNWRCIGEVLKAGATVSGTVKGEELYWVPPFGVPMPFPASSGIRFNNNDASETWNAFIFGGNL